MQERFEVNLIQGINAFWRQDICNLLRSRSAQLLFLVRSLIILRGNGIVEFVEAFIAYWTAHS